MNCREKLRESFPSMAIPTSASMIKNFGKLFTAFPPFNEELWGFKLGARCLQAVLDQGPIEDADAWQVR